MASTKKAHEKEAGRKIMPDLPRPEVTANDKPVAPPLRYQEVFEQAWIGIFTTHEDRFIHANAVFPVMLGYEDAASLIGKNFFDLVHPDDKKAIQRTSENKDKQLYPGRYIFRFVNQKGKNLWVHMTEKSVADGDKNTRIGYVIDINPIKEIGETLQHYMVNHHRIFNEIEDAVVEVDLKGNIVFCNKAAGITLDLSHREMIGRNYRSCMDAETAKKVFQAYNEIYQTGVPSDKIIYEIIRASDGKPRTVEDSVTLLRNAEGRAIGFRIISRDTTDRRETERKINEQRLRLQAIFESVKDGIISVDPDLRVIGANKSMESICGNAVKEIVGRFLPDCTTKCEGGCYAVLRQTLETKNTIREHRLPCNHREHPDQIVSLNSSPLIDMEGNFGGAVLVIRDISLLRDLERELRERHRFRNLIGKSKKMQEIYALLEKLADLETTVLVTGESGTGKELVAKALHYSGSRALKPLVTVNCSALSENLLESELFGHVKGAFTGAINDKQGRFQAADKGTILLDEIGDISPLIQLKLLRVLQEKEFERVGESVSNKVNVRVIACTNKNLRQKVKRGEFREDLYYRLKVVEIGLPPLRERIEDLPLLLEHFRMVFNNRFHKEIMEVSTEALRNLMNYHWPGNVRELEHVIERAFILCNGNIIVPEHLPVEVMGQGEKSDKGYRTKERIPDAAREMLSVLEKTGWNKSKAAGLLGMHRRTIYRKIQQYQLEKPEK